MKLSKKLKSVAVTSAAFLAISTSAAFAGSINGGGSSFADPLMQACKAEAAGVTVNYTSSSSGTGRSSYTAGLFDFAGADSAYGSSDAKPAGLVYVPVLAAPLAVAFNLPGNTDEIYLSAATTAKIFAGKIKKWNDSAIAADNNRTIKTPVYKTTYKTVKGKRVATKTQTGTTSKVIDIDLPALPITVVYRADNSGSSGGFTKWLNNSAKTDWPNATNNDFFKSFPGYNTSADLTSFSNFQGASGSAGVTNVTNNVSGAITYVESSFAKKAGLGIASIGNSAGEFVAPSSAGVNAFIAAATFATDGQYTFNYTTTATGAYPLGLITYGLASSSSSSAAVAADVKKFFTGLLTCPAKYPEIDYSTPTGLWLTTAQAQIAKIG
jgi:phosphate transport system substrate-binding protein